MLNRTRIIVCAAFIMTSSQLTLGADAGPKSRCTAKTPKELADWQASSRTLLFDMLKLSDLVKQREAALDKIPFNVKELSSEVKGTFTLKEIEFDSTPTRRIKAILTIPNNDSASVPAVVCIHGHGGNRHIVYDRGSLYRGF